jgi:hypothetical protein
MDVLLRVIRRFRNRRKSPHVTPVFSFNTSVIGACICNNLAPQEHLKVTRYEVPGESSFKTNRSGRDDRSEARTHKVSCETQSRAFLSSLTGRTSSFCIISKHFVLGYFRQIPAGRCSQRGPINPGAPDSADPNGQPPDRYENDEKRNLQPSSDAPPIFGVRFAEIFGHQFFLERYQYKIH